MASTLFVIITHSMIIMINIYRFFLCAEMLGWRTSSYLVGAATYPDWCVPIVYDKQWLT